jgi:hypothetical protein
VSPWVCPAVAAGGLALLFLLWLPRLRAIGRAQRPEHHREAALALLERRAAIVAGGAETGWATSAGVVIVYSCTPEEGGGVRHHLSLSLGGGPIPLGVALPLVAYLAAATGLTQDRLAVAVTGSGIVHASVVLTTDEHAAWLGGPGHVPAEGPPAVEAFQRARVDRDALLARLERVDLPLQG